MSLGAYNVLAKPLASPFESSSSFSFDGSDDFVDTGIQPDFVHTGATISFWCNMANFSGFQALGCYSSGKQFYVGFNGTNAGFALQATGKSSVDISAHIAVGTWHHISLVADGGTATYYVDGVARDTLSYTPAASANPDTNFYIGAIPDGSGGITYVMEGSIDEVSIFSSALTAREIDAIYNNGRPGSLLHHATLHAHYRMGEGTLTGGKRDGDDNLLFDQSKNGGLGSELVTNGDLSNGTTGWTAVSGATASVVGGKIRVTSSAQFKYVYQSFPTRVDGVYSFTVDVTKGTSPNYDAYVGYSQNGATLFNPGSQGSSAGQGDVQTITGVFTASHANTFVNLRSRNEGSLTDAFTDFDNISVKEVQNVGTISGATVIPDEGAQLMTGFTNGSVYSFDTFTSTGNNITAAVETSGNWAGAASNQISIVNGTTYKVTFNLDYISGTDTLRVVLTHTANGAATTRSNAYYTTTDGVNVAYLTATATDTTAFLQMGTWHETDVINFSATHITLQEVTNGVPLQTTNLKPISRGEKSLSYDGTDDYVDCGTGLGDALGNDYANSLTVSIWFKADTTSGNDGLFEIGSFAGAHGEVRFKVGSNALGFFLNGATWQRDVAFTDTTNWNHVVGIYKAGSEAESKLYLNGTAVGSTTGTFPSIGDLDFAGLKTIIGGYYSASYLFHGSISDVAIWDAALSASAVKALFNAGQTTHLPVNTGAYTYKDNLQAYYKCGNGQQKNAVVDGESNLLFDQANKELGSELFKSGTDLFKNTIWFGAADSQTFTTNSARFTNTGSSANGSFTRLRSTGGQPALLSTPAAGTHLLFECDFLTDDSNAQMLISNAGSYTYLGVGSGPKSLYFTSDGTDDNFVWFSNIDTGSFVEVSNLSLKEVTAGTITGATVVDNNVPRQIYALPPLDNTKSVTLDGSNDHILTNVDATAQANSTSRYYSFWYRGSSASHTPIFDHGSSNVGALHFNLSGNRPYIYMSNNAYRDFADFAQQDSNAWSHVLCRIAFNDIANCELFVDGVKIAVNSTVNTGSMNSYTTGLRIGRGGSNYGNFSVDEFCIFGDLSNPEEVARALYNAGKPIDPSKSLGAANQPQLLRHWWRTGDASLDGTADGTNNVLFQGVQYLGDELIENGTYDSDTSGWTASDGATLTVVEGKLRITSSSSYKYAYQSFPTEVGAKYLYSVTGTKGTSPNYDAYFGNAKNASTLSYPGTKGAADSQGDSVIISDTFTATATTTFITLRSRNEGSIANAFTDFDDVTVKQVRGQYIGQELTDTDPFVTGQWSGFSANAVTFPSTTTVRIERPASGGSSMGAQANLTAGGILQSTPAAGTTLKISFDLNTDDSDVQAQIYDGSGSAYATGGSGSKTVFVTMTGDGFIRFAGLDSSKFVELSNLTVKEVVGVAVLTNMDSASDIQTDTPY